MLNNVMPLRRNSNVDIMNAIRHDAGLLYQARIPEATQANIQETVRNLTNYRPAWNEFVDALVNRIGLVIIRNNSWTNPLAPFKKGLLEFGDTIEEIQVGLLRAYHYDSDRDYMERALFATELPEVQSNFHRVNRQDFYKVSVDEDRLKRAFLSTNGLSDFVSELVESPTKSDQVDEFAAMTALFPLYESNGGFHHVHVPDISNLDSTDADARKALRKIRAVGQNLGFVSTQYNAARMPVAANLEDIVIFATPEAISGFDVNALAAAFNLDKMQAPTRFIPIPKEHLGIDGAQAILTTTDFFQVYDQKLDLESIRNPIPGFNNYFLHHWQVISASRFVPAVLFTTGPDDEIITISHSVTDVEAISILPGDDGKVPTSVVRGGMIGLDSGLTVDPDDEYAPDAVAWSLAGAQSDKTYITNSGVLHIGPDEKSDSIKVTATAVFLDPKNLNSAPKSASKDISVSGDILTDWPAPAPAKAEGKMTAKGVDDVGA